jgi:hypothetical protein
MTKKLEIAGHASESLTHLDDFLDETEISTMKDLAMKLEPYFDDYDYFYNDLFLKTKARINQVSPLELVAAANKIKHLNLLLDLKYSNPSLPLELKKDMINAFFRALENGHTAVILRLLEYPIITNAIVNIKILSSIDSLYIKKITKPSYHAFRYNNHIKPRGNIALIMAAALPTSSIFDHLLQNFPLIEEQLSESALGAFLSATRTAQGNPKESINQTIINQLLEFPHVYKYAQTREFDFGDLLMAFDELKAKSAEALQEIQRGFCSRFFDKVSSSNELSALDEINLTHVSSFAVTDGESPSSGISISPFYIESREGLQKYS